MSSRRSHNSISFNAMAVGSPPRKSPPPPPLQQTYHHTCRSRHYLRRSLSLSLSLSQSYINTHTSLLLHIPNSLSFASNLAPSVQNRPTGNSWSPCCSRSTSLHHLQSPIPTPTQFHHNHTTFHVIFKILSKAEWLPRRRSHRDRRWLEGLEIWTCLVTWKVRCIWFS